MARRRTLSERVAALEKRVSDLEKRRRPIGFVVDQDEVRGRAVAQHDEEQEDAEIVDLRRRG